MKLIVSSSALADIERLRSFLADKSPSASTRAMVRIRGAMERLQSFPQAGRSSAVENARELVVPFGKSAYIVRHFALTEEVVILRIWHGREDRP